MKRSFPNLPRARRAPLLLAVIGGALLSTCAAPGWAQTAPATPGGVPAPAPAPAFSSPINTNVQAVGPNFKLQAGDVLAVQVANHPEMSATSIAVAANGTLNLPIVGTLSAQGKTIGQVTSQISHAYETQLKRPQVSVTLVSSVARQLIIRGAISKPGPVDVRNDLRLSEVIANAGGLMVDGVAITGAEARATLVRGKNAVKPLDLATALAIPQSPANIVLKAGDVINITALPIVNVALAGDGVAPSTVKIRLSSNQQQVHVSDVLKAGGSIRGKAAQTRGALVRGDKKTELNVPALFDGSNPNADLVVQNGDLLTFDTIEAKKLDITVASFDGSVKTPGTYTFDNDASALRALVQAGGFATDIQPDQVTVTVQRGGRIIPVDVGRAALNPQLDVPLENKDYIYAAYNPSPRVRLLGPVAKPDIYRLKKDATLLDAITTAGGLVNAPTQTSIRIVRTSEDGKRVNINVDAARLIGMTDLTQNVRLQDGDLVFLSESRHGRQIYISGEVTAPGAMDLGETDGLAELLIKAGGAKPTAALSRLSITSHGTQRFVDASSLANGGKLDVPLEEGDYVNVPFNDAHVTVVGAVGKPDNYIIPENHTLTLGNALLLAGSTANNAKLKEVAVIHRLPDNTTKTDIIPVDNLALSKGVLNIDYPLRNGDVVYVPQGRATVGGIAKATQTAGVIGLGLRLFGAF